MGEITLQRLFLCLKKTKNQINSLCPKKFFEADFRDDFDGVLYGLTVCSHLILVSMNCQQGRNMFLVGLRIILILLLNNTFSVVSVSEGHLDRRLCRTGEVPFPSMRPVCWKGTLGNFES